MNRQKRWTTSGWIPCILALMMVTGLAGCRSPTPTPTPMPPAPPTPTPTPPSPPTPTPTPLPPPTPTPTPSPPEKPTIDPAGPDITVEAGKTIPVRANAPEADDYRWELQGDGEISATEGDTILYTAPEQVAKGGAMALLAVVAYNDGGESAQNTLIINVPAPLIVRGKVCKYREDFLVLGDRLFLCTTEFHDLGLPIGARVTVTTIVDGAPCRAPGLILDHDAGLLNCGFRLSEATRIALCVDDDVKIPVEDRPIRDLQVTVNPVPTPSPTTASFDGRVCQYKEDFHTLGDRLFLRTAEFNLLGLPIGAIVTVAVTVDDTSYQVSGLILDHDDEMAECTIRLNRKTRIALGVNGDVDPLNVTDHPIRSFQITTQP